MLKETEAAVKVPEKKVPRDLGQSVASLAQAAGIRLEVKPWEMLSGMAKDAARGWFVKRAEGRGIPWAASVEKYHKHQEELDRLFAEVNDPKIEYPAYYRMPFHGYDEGNLSWRAAHELEPATKSMCLGYYDEGVSWQEAQEKFRGAARRSIQDWWRTRHGAQGANDDVQPPKTLLDVGCSYGFSTQEMAAAFPGVKATGVDLSPYFLAVAKLDFPQHTFVHAMGERTGLPDGSFDVATLNFLLHELPLEASRATLREMYRILAPGGVLAVLDVDPRRLVELPPLRRWAFQVTEPWCKEGEYYSLDLEQELRSIGFEEVKVVLNDPVNVLVLAAKGK